MFIEPKEMILMTFKWDNEEFSLVVSAPADILGFLR